MSTEHLIIATLLSIAYIIFNMIIDNMQKKRRSKELKRED
jgi:hypothetical protein